MKLSNKLFSLKRKGNDRGFTLLEYCAGAAVLITVVYGGVEIMGGNLKDFLVAVGGWAKTKTTEVGTPQQPS